MKIRNGFVSNSSSSSFVAVGIKIDDKSLNKRAILKENFSRTDEAIDKWGIESEWYDILSDNNYFYINGVLMQILAEDEQNLEDKEYSFSQLKNIGEDLLKKFNISHILEIKLYMGTRSH